VKGLHETPSVLVQTVEEAEAAANNFPPPLISRFGAIAVEYVHVTPSELFATPLLEMSA
jgi:hypothetical protein